MITLVLQFLQQLAQAPRQGAGAKGDRCQGGQVMDRIGTMASFVEVARHGSFSVAAKQLGLSRALVSRHVLDLERRLEVRLLNRTTRSVTPTEAGRRHLAFCIRMLDDLQTEDSVLHRMHEQPEGILKVIAPMWFGSLDLGGVITDFIRAHPRISVNLTLGGFGSRTFGFLEEGFDVAIHTRKMPASRLIARRVGMIGWTLAASPAYLAAHAAPQTPEALREHACLAHGHDMPWHFRVKSRTVRIATAPVMVSNSYMTLRTASLRGLGIAMLPSCVVNRDIAKCELVPVLPAVALPDRPLFVAYSPGGRPPAKVTLFVRHLAQRFRAAPLPDARETELPPLAQAAG